jgi:SAM-dependent methyltransferase
MDEQEILAILRTHVARTQGDGAGRPPSANDAVPTTRVDFSQLEQLSAELLRLRSRVGQLNPRNGGFVNRVAQAVKKLVQRSLSWYTRSLHDYHDGVNHALDYHARAIASLQKQIQNQGGGLAEALREALRTARRATQEQQAPYAALFRGLEPVLDLGCGRGEFLELLKEEGVPAFGVDSDGLACEDARHRSLNVVQADLFDYVSELPDRSLGGLFSSRLIEYLPMHLQSELVKLCSDKLKPAGLLVIETLNPDSEFPVGRNAHVDPTHLGAVYPEVLRSMLESCGFEDIRICVLAPQEVHVAAAPGAGKAEKHVGGAPSSRDFGQAPAYAAIARRQ